MPAPSKISLVTHAINVTVENAQTDTTIRLASYRFVLFKTQPRHHRAVSSQELLTKPSQAD